MADQVGQQIGSYRLTRLLGSGGFADVYRGEHVFLKTQAAIKVMKPNEFQDFLKEAQTIAALKHPRIVRVLDFGVQGTLPFLVMDYASLGTLRDRHPASSVLQVSTVLPYVKQVAEALQYAHDHQLIHRDIKPENMLVETESSLLLSDFGIAIIAHKTQSLSTQEAIGTVTYMAPEQIRSKARPASDQYSLGIVIYEWLCGVCPFEGTTPIEVAMSHMTDLPSSLRAKVPAIPVQVEQVVLKALAKDPQQRFASVRAFAEAFEQASRPAKPTVKAASSPKKPPASALAPTVYAKVPSPLSPLPPAQQQAAWGAQAPAYLPRRSVPPPPPKLPTPSRPRTGSIRRSRTRVLLTCGVLVLLILAGVVWVAISPNSLNGIAWSGSRFVAVGDKGTILTSPDGNTWTWTTHTSGTSQWLWG